MKDLSSWNCTPTQMYKFVYHILHYSNADGTPIFNGRAFRNLPAFLENMLTWGPLPGGPPGPICAICGPIFGKPGGGGGSGLLCKKTAGNGLAPYTGFMITERFYQNQNTVK